MRERNPCVAWVSGFRALTILGFFSFLAAAFLAVFLSALASLASALASALASLASLSPAFSSSALSAAASFSSASFSSASSSASSSSSFSLSAAVSFAGTSISYVSITSTCMLALSAQSMPPRSSENVTVTLPVALFFAVAFSTPDTRNTPMTSPAGLEGGGAWEPGAYVAVTSKSLLTSVKVRTRRLCAARVRRATTEEEINFGVA